MNKLWGLIKKHKIVTSILFTAVMVTAVLGVQITPTKTLNKSSVSIGQIGQKYEITIGSGVDASTTADYTATGTAAQQTNTFQVALNALPTTGGILTILSGNYTLNATLTRAIPNVTIDGIGNSTIFSDNGSTPIFAAGSTGWNFQNLVLDAGGISGTCTGSNITIGTTYYSVYGGLNAPTGRTAYVIAASNSNPDDKNQANITLGASTDLGATVNNAVTAGYYNIALCSGTFAQSTAFNWGTTVVTLKGAGRNITYVTQASSLTTFTFSTGGVASYDTTIEDITFTGTTGDVAMNVLNYGEAIFINIEFVSYPTVLTANNMQHVKYINCYFRNCGNNSTSAFIFSTVESSDIWFTNCDWEINLGSMFEAQCEVVGLYFTAPKAEWYSGNYSFIKTTGSGYIGGCSINGGFIINDSGTCNVPFINCSGSLFNSISGLCTQGLVAGILDVSFSGYGNKNNSVITNGLNSVPQGYTNLIANGSFENGSPPNSWLTYDYDGGYRAVFSQSNTQAKIGTYSGKIVSSAFGLAEFYEVISAVPYRGLPVTLGCWVWCATPSVSYIDLNDAIGGADMTSYYTGTSTWQWLTITYMVGAAQANIQVALKSGVSATTYFDGAILVQGYSCPPFSPMPALAATE